MLNRLDPIFFPKIFGKNKDGPLDKQASIDAFQKIAEKINF